MKLKRAAGIFSSLAILMWAGAAQAQSSDAVEQLDKGLVNWSQGFVEAVGVGAPSPRAPTPSAARLFAERAAQVDGYRNLLETVKGVRVDSETVFENFMTTSDVIRTRVEGIVRGARVIDKRYMSDGAVEVTMRMPLQGDLTGVMLEQVRSKTAATGKRVSNDFSVSVGTYNDVLRGMQTQRDAEVRRKLDAEAELRKLEEERRALEAQRKAEAERKKLAEVEARQKSAAAEVERAEAERVRLDQLISAQEESQQVAAIAGESEKEPVKPESKLETKPEAKPAAAAPAADAALVTAFNLKKGETVDPDETHPWTGLIVDARGLGLRPSLVPKLLTTDGTVVYGARSVGFDDAVKSGLVGYARDVEAARKHLRVTDDPMMVKGAKSYGPKNSDVILYDGDVDVLNSSAKDADFFSKARVMIVYN
ncbi:MAG: LPP20 family lipoprotein [Chrysiogenetes bacterium]|nr:LPP20 family lipoprotein [Chrysiogenetes bacterium]